MKWKCSIFFIIEEAKETILDFPQGTVKVSLISIGFNANYIEEISIRSDENKMKIIKYQRSLLLLSL